MEVKDLKDRIESLERALWMKKEERRYDLQLHALAMEACKNELREEMQKDLITSDLKRVEAVASLKAYKEMDNKDDREHIRTMLADAIKSLGNKPQIVVK